MADLSAMGWTQSRIAGAMGRSQAWVSKVARVDGLDILWADGERLLKLREKQRAAFARAMSR